MKQVRLRDGRIVDQATHQIEEVRLSDGRITTNTELSHHPEDWHQIVLRSRPLRPFPPSRCTYWNDREWKEWRQRVKWEMFADTLIPIN
ncbi:MAG: hypothetical protein HOG49_31745 [Candidatus Scalindua sp.]|jgi:hypothetical protein|nr:hypothetical protein [Candidatus Scalindua sp.]